MNDLEFIKRFSKITIKKQCEKLKIDRANLLSNRLNSDKIKAVREEIENEIALLYLKEKSKNE